MAADPFYQVCCITGERATREDPIEWHHNLTFAGKQVQEAFAILPVKRSLHYKANEKSLRARMDWVMLSRASEEQMERFSKAIDRRFALAMLEQVYGKWSSPEGAINY